MPDRAEGARFRDPTSSNVYVLDDRPAKWPGLVPAHIEGDGSLVQLREEDLGTRLILDRGGA